MLASLLRWLILLQLLAGAALGWCLHQRTGWPMGVVILVALLAPVLGTVLVLTLSAVVSRNRAEPLGLWWRSVWGEWLAGVRFFVFTQPWRWKNPGVQSATVNNPHAIPVVLVHGYLCNHRIWDGWIAALQAQGHAVIAVDLEPIFGSIDDYADVVESAVQSLLQHTGAKKVALIGHSMGGLAIRARMRQHGTEHIAKVITLGTPHAGTHLGRLASTTNGKQMAYQSAWLQALAQHETDTTRALMRIAITPQDNIVFGQREQVLPGVAPKVFEGVGHLQMCTDREIRDWVLGELKDCSEHPAAQ